MKKLLALILALICVLSTTACGSISQEDAEKTAKTFLDAYMDLDKDKIEDIVDNPDKLEAIIDYDAKKKEAMETLPENLKAYEANYEEFFDAVFEKMKSKMSYTIKDTVVNGSEATVTAEIVIPNTESFDAKAVLSERLNDEAIKKMVTELAKEGKITKDSTKDEILDLIMPLMIDQMVETVDDINFETETLTKDLVVYKKDGKLLINAEKSDLPTK